MSGWLDPLGLRAVRRELTRRQYRMLDLAETTERIHPGCRRARRYRARAAEIARSIELLNLCQRPSAELVGAAGKELIQKGSEARRQVLDALSPGFDARLARTIKETKEP